MATKKRPSLPPGPAGGPAASRRPKAAITRTRDGIIVARVAHIADIMRRGAWERGVTGKELAAEWGLPATTVEHYSKEAWKRVCAEADDAAAARPTIAGTLSVALAQSADRRDHKSTAALADTWSRVVGARAPEKHMHAVVVAQYDAMPKAGKVEWLRERARELEAEAARLEAEGEPR
jgi:hypothetical protein